MIFTKEYIIENCLKLGSQEEPAVREMIYQLVSECYDRTRSKGKYGYIPERQFLDNVKAFKNNELMSPVVHRASKIIIERMKFEYGLLSRQLKEIINDF